MIPMSTSRPAHSDVAYVTLLANEAYLPGAIALLQSLVWTKTQADLVVMHTDQVGEGALDQLTPFNARLVHVPLLELSDEFNARHERKKVHDAAPFTKGRKPDFHSPLWNFCKLRLWQLTEYRKCVFLDADTIVVRNSDKLFGYPEFCGAPNVYESLLDFHRLNSGVFTAVPAQETYADMLQKLDQPEAFWPRTDQTFLQSYFPDWHGLPIFYNMLQYVWFHLPELWDWQSVSIIHYQYEKPWEKDHPRKKELRPLIDLWAQYYKGEMQPGLEALSSPVSSGIN